MKSKKRKHSFTDNKKECLCDSSNMVAWFELYPLNVVSDDIKAKLIDKGIPENEIAYIHNAKTEKQKSELFDNVNIKYRCYSKAILFR